MKFTSQSPDVILDTVSCLCHKYFIPTFEGSLQKNLSQLKNFFLNSQRTLAKTLNCNICHLNVQCVGCTVGGSISTNSCHCIWMNVWSCMRSLSSQEDGRGPGSRGSFFSQDLPEPASTLVRPDAVRGDVSGYQYFHILQWLLQQTWGDVSREGTVCEGGDEEDLWTRWSSTTKETPEQNNRGGSRPLSLSVYHITTLRLTWIHDLTWRRFGRLYGQRCL